MKNSIQSGRSMIEMLGVLAVIGVLSVGGFGMVSKMQNSRDTNAISEEITTLARKARAYVRGTYPSSDTNNTTSITINKKMRIAKSVPDEFMADEPATADDSAFTGTSDAKYMVYTMDSSLMLIVIKVTGLNDEVCMQIANSNWGSTASSGFAAISVNAGSFSKMYNVIYNSTAPSTSDKMGIPGNATYPSPVGIGNASNWCSGNNNTIYMAFK